MNHTEKIKQKTIVICNQFNNIKSNLFLKFSCSFLLTLFFVQLHKV